MRRLQASVGFTLLEMALVLFVMSILLAGMVSPLVSARDRLNRALTQQQLQRIESALIGHLLAQGRLPCAASRDSGGLEQASASGCERYAGFLPAATLGVMGSTDPNGLLLDPWHRPFHYRISAADSDADGASDYAVAGGVSLQTPQLIRADNRVMQAVDGDCGSVAIRADAIVAVVVSEGKTAARSEAERENTDADAIFVSRLTSDADGCAFDDQMVWLTENRVLTVLLQAGALPRSH